MKASRRKFEEFANVLGMHNAARRVYQATIGRRGAEASAKLRRFYSSLVPAGVLVFDIGANTGKYAEAIASLGARVVALEPNGDCVRHIELSYRANRIDVIQAVVGPQNGLASLKVSDARDDISSMSVKWMEVLEKQHQNYRGLWNREVVVPMLTVDTLIRHYGVPHYIKVDVEGFEECVLDGLSIQPALLSFEFNLALLDAAVKCLDKRILKDTSEFNITFGDELQFRLDRWQRDRNELVRLLKTMKSEDKYGDIFVRTTAS